MNKVKIFKNLIKISIGTILSSLFLFIANFIAAKSIGPSEYGKYSLIISTSNLLIIPMLFNLNLSATRYLARKKSTEKYITSIIVTVLFFSLTTTLIALAFQNLISKLLGIETPVYLFAVIYSFALSMKYIFEATLRGKFKFNQIFVLDVFSALVILISTLILVIIRNENNFSSYTFAVIFGFIAYISVAGAFLYNYYSIPKFSDFKKIKRLFHYSTYGTLGSISNFILGSADKLILNQRVGTFGLGIYSAYNNVSTTMVGQLVSVFNTVIFPEASKLKNKKKNYQELKPYLFLSLVPLALLEIIIIRTVIFLLGGQYQFDIRLTVLVVISSLTYFLFQIPMTFNLSRGVIGIRANVFTSLVISIFSIPLNYIAVNQFGSYGLPMVATVSNLSFYLVYNHLLNEKDN